VRKRATNVGCPCRIADGTGRAIPCPEESIAIAREGIASAGEFGVERHWGDFLRGELAGRLVQLGRWREAERLLEEITDRSPTGVHAGMAYRCLGYLQVGLGEFDPAARALDRAEQHTRRSLGSMTLAPPAVARASLELWAGRPQAAAAVVSDCLQRVGDGEHVFFTARLYELGARACADLAARAPGDDLTKKRQTVTAERLLERLDGLIARMTGVIPPVVLASWAACAAEYARIGGAGDAALWADARRHREACMNPYQAAYARWREAEALLASGGDGAPRHEGWGARDRTRLCSEGVADLVDGNRKGSTGTQTPSTAGNRAQTKPRPAPVDEMWTEQSRHERQLQNQ
jgi:hypothetical protein